MRANQLTCTDYDFSNKRLNKLLEDFPDEQIVVVQGPAGRIPISVPRGLVAPESHAAAKERYLVLYKAKAW